MRSIPLLVSLTLTLAAFAALPTADAAREACAIGTPGCAGFVCLSEDSDGKWSESECVTKRDLDRCQFQSDCCSTVSGLWCPETD